MSQTYRLFGLVVTSAIPLPLPPSSQTPQMRLVRGTVEARGELLWRDDLPSGFACWRHDGAVILEWPGARFLVTRRHVVIDTQRDDYAVDFLLQPAWSVVLAAHGREAFHGAVVERDGKGLAVFGSSGTGKSTASLLLLDRGWRLVADDLLVCDQDGCAVPGPPMVRLMPDRAAGKPGRIDAAGKLRYVPAVCPEPVPIVAGVVLAEAYREPTRLLGIDAVNALLEHVYNPVITHPAQAGQRLDQAIRFVARTALYGAPPRCLSADQLEDLVEGTTR